jgi:hypothetical protein
MNKAYAALRGLFVVVAIASAFVTIPHASAALLVLGLLAGFGYAADDYKRLYLVTLVLAIASKPLGELPGGGSQLAVIIASLSVAAVGASLTTIGIGLVRGIMADWTKTA